MTSPVIADAEAPMCVARLLRCLEETGRDLAASKPVGPYRLEALLQDVRLCPAIAGPESHPALCRRDAEVLARRLADARHAAAVALACPAATRDFAVERLASALAAAREALSRRPGQTRAEGYPSAALGERCTSCVFRQDTTGAS